MISTPELSVFRLRTKYRTSLGTEPLGMLAAQTQQRSINSYI